MAKKITFLTPIKIDKPPYHTQVWPRCFTCSKFEICNLREDYLRTLQLMQNVLGDPQEDLQLQKSNPRAPYQCYVGNLIENPENIFPEELDFSKRTLPDKSVITEVLKGKLESAKYQDLNTVLFLYDTEGYKVLFKALYDEKAGEYEIFDGIEMVYGIIYEFPADSILEVQVNLKTWREQKEEQEKEDIEIINTTYFSAQLNCDFYDPVRGLTPEKGMERLIAKFPEGIPCKDGSFYHIETLHIEPNKIPMYNPNAGKVAFAPIPYPIFVARKCKKEKPCKRDDLNE